MIISRATSDRGDKPIIDRHCALRARLMPPAIRHVGLQQNARARCRTPRRRRCPAIYRPATRYIVLGTTHSLGDFLARLFGEYRLPQAFAQEEMVGATLTSLYGEFTYRDRDGVAPANALLSCSRPYEEIASSALGTQDAAGSTLKAPGARRYMSRFSHQCQRYAITVMAIIDDFNFSNSAQARPTPACTGSTPVGRIFGSCALPRAYSGVTLNISRRVSDRPSHALTSCEARPSRCARAFSSR